MTNITIDTPQVQEFISNINFMIEEYYKRNAPLEKSREELRTKQGKKNIKLFRLLPNGSKEFHGIIDRETGDIFKGCGAHTILEGARGNIFKNGGRDALSNFGYIRLK